MSNYKGGKRSTIPYEVVMYGVASDGTASAIESLSGGVKTNLDPLASQGYFSSTSVRNTIKERGFIGGAPSTTTTDNIRTTLENPSGSGIVAVAVSIVVAHDQGSAIVDLQVLRNPTTSLPTTARTPINASLRGVSAPAAVSLLKSDAGVAMSGHTGSVTVPTQGNNPNQFSLSSPVLIYPGELVGLNYKVGAALASGIAGTSIVWYEVPESEIEAVRMS